MKKSRRRSGRSGPRVVRIQGRVARGHRTAPCAGFRRRAESNIDEQLDVRRFRRWTFENKPRGRRWCTPLGPEICFERRTSNVKRRSYLVPRRRPGELTRRAALVRPSDRNVRDHYPRLRQKHGRHRALPCRADDAGRGARQDLGDADVIVVKACGFIRCGQAGVH